MPCVICSNCASTNFSSVRTYKHDWHQCNDCGLVQRERRSSYPFDTLPIRALVMRSRLRKLFGDTLLRVADVVEEESKFYDLYKSAATMGAKGTKWAPLIKSRLADFEKHGIAIAGKSVLEISGGPGFLAQAMQAVAQRVVVTEFSQLSADGMAKALNIDAVAYDYNSDQISQKVSGSFDVVLIMYSIGYCNDLGAFVRSLKPLIHDATVIYVCHSPGSLGLMLRSQFDEYTYNRCWGSETVAKCFAEIGFCELAREDEGSYPYDLNWYNASGTLIGGLLQRVHRVIARYYRWRALDRHSSVNRELVQKNVKQIFGTKAA